MPLPLAPKSLPPRPAAAPLPTLSPCPLGAPSRSGPLRRGATPPRARTSPPEQHRRHRAVHTAGQGAHHMSRRRLHLLGWGPGLRDGHFRPDFRRRGGARGPALACVRRGTRAASAVPGRPTGPVAGRGAATRAAGGRALWRSCLLLN